MKLPGTLDPRWLRGRPADGDQRDDGYEYIYVDGEAGDLDEGWEWVEFDDPDVGDAPADAPATTVLPADSRGRRFGRLVATLLPLDESAGDDLDPLADPAPPQLVREPNPDPDVQPEPDPGVGPEPVPALRSELEPEPASTRWRRPSWRSHHVAAEAAGPDDHELEDHELEEPWYLTDGEDFDDDDDVEDGGRDAMAVDPRIAARRDGVTNARRTRRRHRVVALAIAAGAVLTLGAITRSAVLDVNQVIVAGADRAPVDELAAASGITPGTPLLGLDLEEAAAKVRAQPWVLDASVDRTWSGTVAISVIERAPVATVNAGDGGWLLIDRDRRVLATSAQPPSLPIVDGVGVAAVGDELAPEAQAALDVAAALTPGLRTRVALVNGADPGGVELTLQPSGTVRFGPATQLAERIGSLQAVFAQVDLLCLERIDLGVPDAPVLTRVPACA